MAARKDLRTRPRFYVYRFDNEDGTAAYIGKGSKNRLRVQATRFGTQGYVIARFWRESDAYKYEIVAIAENRPSLNRHPGGNGSRATPVRQPTRAKWEIEMERVGTRVYAARFLLSRFLCMLDPAKVAQIRSVAYGG
jgi:hypothetical protein